MNSGRSSGRTVDVDFVQHVIHDTAADLHPRRDFLMHEMERHFHVDLLRLVHALKVDVHDLMVLDGMHLHITQQDLLALAVELHVENRCVKRFVAELALQREVFELDRLRRLAAAVHDAGHLAATAETAARTRSLDRSRICGEFNFHDMSPEKQIARDQAFRGWVVQKSWIPAVSALP